MLRYIVLYIVLGHSPFLFILSNLSIFSLPLGFLIFVVPLVLSTWQNTLLFIVDVISILRDEG
ncbi:uncharacterized protein B0T23DRAFT_165487 [Neurospora hispaniola]|uniref:Uncharacterized protein n=1 Tax=Neurospora hispaniola TaxID=588809 RepID=A0AAJ0I5Q5_9PEZI|nr:hypothetical protein B0T23DRAFT_165487 [Neurospora hispaniola]